MSLNVNLNDVDLNEIGVWPWAAKIGVLLFISVCILFLGYWLDTKKQMLSLDSAQQEALSLRSTFETKQHLTANVEVYKEQMATMTASLGALSRQLPEKAELSGLIEDISHQGLRSGLAFRSIRLHPERQIDFYAELPIEISVIGTFHQFGEFLSNVVSLPRIVTLHDFVIMPAPDEVNGNILIMNITAKAYCYVKSITPYKIKSVERFPEIKPYEPFTYTASHLRSPFVLSVSQRRHKEVLEAYPLDSLKMVGTIEKNNKRWVLIKDPNGIVYRLMKGNYVGQHHGRIDSITNDKILLTEIVPDINSGWRERPATMALLEYKHKK